MLPVCKFTPAVCCLLRLAPDGCIDVPIPCVCRCAELQPLDAAAWNALGRVEVRRGNHAEAAAAFERAEALLSTSSAGMHLHIPLFLT